MMQLTSHGHDATCTLFRSKAHFHFFPWEHLSGCQPMPLRPAPPSDAESPEFVTDSTGGAKKKGVLINQPSFKHHLMRAPSSELFFLQSSFWLTKRMRPQMDGHLVTCHPKMRPNVAICLGERPPLWERPAAPGGF